MPWLLGILVRHAREERRRRARSIDATRVARPEALRPEAHALASEAALELERALAELSSEDRAVLDDYLRADKTPAEIARERGLAPGAARMRIHRGLDRLRRSLPAGLALGAASAQGLAAVRAVVLRAGATAVKVSSPGAGSVLGAGTAGVLMGKKLMLAGILGAVAGLWLLTGRDGRGEEPEGVAVARVSSELEREDPVLEPGAQEHAAANSTLVILPDTGSSRVPGGTPAGDPDLAAVRGRVVEHDGTPVSGMPVTLLEAEEDELFPASFSTLDAAPVPRLVASSAETDRDGVFLLRGVRVRAVHNLGLDLGGERASQRMLDAKLVPGEETDLGDVVLAAGGAIAGRVVDPEGHGVAGARVRIGPLPGFLVALGLQQIAAGCALAELNGEDELLYAFELPAWLSEFERLLPLATTTTNQDGRFELARVAAGDLTALIDAPGFARLTSGSSTLHAGERLELGELALTHGATVQGRVLDAAGKPVAGAEVRAGSAAVEGQIAVLGPARATDGEGRFRIEHVAAGHVLALARRDAQAPWTAARGRGDELTLELPAEQELVVEVVDAAGRPVDAPEFFLRPGDERMDALSVFAPPFSPRPARRVEGSPERWSLGADARGRHVVAARAAGLAQAVSPVELGASVPPATRLVLAALRRVEVFVRDAGTRMPVAGALVRAEEHGSYPLTVLVSARTGADGRATLDLPERAEPALWLGVAHPRFAPQGRALDGSSSIEISLTSGARLVTRLADPSLAREGCTLQLGYSGNAQWPEVHLPRLFALPHEGSLELENLSAGEWTWNLFEPVGAKEALVLLDPEHAPEHLAQGKIELVDGQTFVLVLRRKGVQTPASGAGATLSGVVRVEGRLAGELSVGLYSLDDDPDRGALSQKTTGGRFRFESVPAGQYTLVVYGAEGDGSAILARENLALADGEERTLDFDVESLAVHIQVWTEEGRPSAGAEVRVQSAEGGKEIPGGRATTDERGRASLTMARPGRYQVTVTQKEEGLVRGELEVTAGGANELALTLSRGVECSGTVRIEPGTHLEERTALLVVSRDGARWISASCELDLAGGSAPFRFVGFPAGKYSVRLLCGEEMLAQRFELSEAGASALELRFSADD